MTTSHDGAESRGIASLNEWKVGKYESVEKMWKEKGCGVWGDEEDLNYKSSAKRTEETKYFFKTAFKRMIL
jgi:hypothetical protein